MKSKITIEVDFENGNQPVLNVIFRDSDDVRDKLVANFLKSLGHTSRWCTIQYGRELIQEGGQEYGYLWKIVPVKPQQLPQEMDLMRAVVNDSPEKQ